MSPTVTYLFNISYEHYLHVLAKSEAFFPKGCFEFFEFCIKGVWWRKSHQNTEAVDVENEAYVIHADVSESSDRPWTKVRIVYKSFVISFNVHVLDKES